MGITKECKHPRESVHVPVSHESGVKILKCGLCNKSIDVTDIEYPVYPINYDKIR